MARKLLFLYAKITNRENNASRGTCLPSAAAAAFLAGAGGRRTVGTEDGAAAFRFTLARARAEARDSGGSAVSSVGFPVSFELFD